MGDHRPKITAHFEMHGHVADFDFGWCNWSDNGDGIDQRIVDWFRDQAEIAMGRYQEQLDKSLSLQRIKETEKREREEYERLKLKFAKSP